MPQIMNSGGLFDASRSIYGLIPGAIARKNPRPHWLFPSGAIIYFAHLQFADTVYDWQGTEITLIEFDEATHFEESQFWYMLSRNRSTCGIKPYFRMSTNPDPDSFVRKLMSWWIDDSTGLAIPERSGVIRYMARINGEVVWGDTPQEVAEQGAELEDIKSFTFIMSSVYDNQELLKRNPEYIGNLRALPTVEQERLLNGNWNIRPAAGLYFKRSRVNMLEDIPNDVVQWVRAWDLAATEDRKGQNPEDGPAYTAGVLMGKRRCGRYIVADVINQRLDPAGVERTVLNTAKSDKAKYKHVKIRLSIDPGQSGVAQNDYYIKLLSGFSVVSKRESGSKETRAEPLSSQWIGQPGNEYGNVDVLIAPWNEAYFSQLESFPESKFKDMVDSSSNAFNELMYDKVNILLNESASVGVMKSQWKI